MSEQYGYNDLGEDHLIAVVDHAQSQIEMWQHRQQVALGRLATLMAGYEYPQGE
jgi:hypothetical protein